MWYGNPIQRRRRPNIAKKAKKVKPFGACDYCWQLHPAESTYAVEIPENPNIIIVVERASHLSGQGGRLLKYVCERIGAKPIFIPARMCDLLGAVPLPEIKRNREAVLIPTLAAHNLPVVVMGMGAAYVAGGQCSDTSMVNKTYVMYDRVCSFTYDMAYYLNNGRDKQVLENIETTIQSALVVAPPLPWSHNLLPNHIEKLIVDVETTNTEFPWYNSKIIQIGFKEIGGNSFVFKPEDLDDEEKKYFADNVKLIVGHNIMFDLVHLAYVGITFPHARVHDTMIYHKNSHPNELYYGLKPLAKKYFGLPHWDAWFASKHLNGEAVDVSSPEQWRQLCDYNVFDLYATELLFLEQQKYTTQFAVEMDYLKYVHKMIMNGMYVDREKWEEMYVRVSKQAEEAVKGAKEAFGLGADFNFNSPPQVLGLLRTYDDDIPSTGADVLCDYSHIPVVGELLNIRDLVKLKGTGLEGLKEHFDSDGLVHSSYAVHGAETGRSSSSSPNMQNTDPRVRPLFTSRYQPGGRLVHTDLSGIEYRLIGHASEDKILLDVFNTGKDIHDEMYFALFGEYPPDKKLRKKAKTANFCGVYGGGYGKFLLSAELPDTAESKLLFGIVSRRYPGVAQWKERVIRDLHRTRRIRNLFGRTRQFAYINKDIEREAINWIIQSSGHDILKIYCMTMCDMIAEAGYEKTLLCSEVHDSNTFDSPSDEYSGVYELIRGLASDLNPLIQECYGVKMKVPILADVEIMQNWA